MAKRTISFNVMLAPIEKANLDALSDLEGRTMGAIVRELIGRRYEMLTMLRPRCVNGDRCFVPHMHADKQTTPQGGTPLSPPGTPE